MKSFKLRSLSLLCALAVLPARAEIVVTDVGGTRVRLAAPAKRIVSLAPHITELVYAAGAGERMVGNVEYGDFPPAAARLAKIGGYSRLDLEAIVALKPDLVLGWQSGNLPAAVARLRALGFTVHLSQSNRIEDIAGVIAANPEVIVASGMGDSRPEWLDDWRRWTTLAAVARDNLYFVPPELIQRHTPRILDGTEQLCAHLEAARAKRGK